MEFLLALLIIAFSSIVIMFTCDSFDGAASYLGRNMAPGVRGATINAIGSSMPELMTAAFLLFLYHDQDGFAAGIATTAGSAIFNAVIIPAVCIFAVRYGGVITVGMAGARKKVRSIEISKPSVLRDGFFLLAAEAALILFLGGTSMAWWMGLTLMGVYGVYFLFLMRGFNHNNDEEVGDSDDSGDSDDAEEREPLRLRALMTFDFKQLLFGNGDYNKGSAWVVLALATLVLAVACYAVAEGVMISAAALNVPPYFTALILAAAATSVPDTVLSVKDAMRGDYDDAIGNAIGSNTFDITVALGLPLTVYALMYGDVMVMSADATQSLRIVLFGVTFVVLSAFLLPRRITVTTAWLLFAIYLAWMGFVIYGATTVVAG